jgi:hypothetical protein
MAEKFLMAKASAGLGNRLLSLCTAMLYAEMSGRTLVIDWRDGAYGKKGENAFDNFFSCRVAKPLSVLPKTDSVTPSVWKGNLNKISQIRADENKIHMEKFQLTFQALTILKR